MAENTQPELRPVVTLAEAKATGQTRYFTGLPCCAGHVGERTTHNRECMACHNSARIAKRALARRSRPLSPRAAAKAAGLTRYFTGKPCPKGHIAERLVSSIGCTTCNDLKRQELRDKARGGPARPELPRSQRKLNSSMGLRYCYVCKRTMPFAAFSEAKSRTDGLSYRCRSCYAAWRIANPVKVRVNNANRRARKFIGGGHHTLEDIAFLEKIQRSRCAHSWCRVALTSKRHIDHIIPLARGGPNGRRNLQLLCQRCNNRKHAKHPIDFAQQNGMLL